MSTVEKRLGGSMQRAPDRPHPMALSMPTDSEVLCPSVSSLSGPPGPLPSTATFEMDPEEDATSKRELFCSMRNWGT